jgi:hypothetical protein
MPKRNNVAGLIAGLVVLVIFLLLVIASMSGDTTNVTPQVETATASPTGSTQDDIATAVHGTIQAAGTQTQVVIEVTIQAIVFELVTGTAQAATAAASTPKP